MRINSAPSLRLAKLILLLALILVAVAITNYFSFYPIHRAADEPEVFGEVFLANSSYPIALVVDTSVIRQSGKSGKFSKTDWSYGWINLLLQESRQYDVIDISELNSEENHAFRSIWIFTRSALAGSASDELSALLDSLAKGARANQSREEVVVYLEAPDTLSAKNLTVMSLLGEKVESTKYSQLTQIQLPSEFTGPTVPEFRFECDGLVASDAKSRLVTLISFDSLPVLREERRLGLRILVATFDFGQMAVTIQQGKPNDDFSVTAKIKKRTGLLPIVSSDLCADSSYYFGFTPFFDLFEHGLFALISGQVSNAPLFESSPKGAFIMSHDEEGMGDKSAWMARQEQIWGVTSATLVTPAAITEKGLSEIISAGGEVGLHIDQYSYFKRPGLPGLRPVKIEYSIIEQKKSLQALMPSPKDSKISINRNHWLLWSENYTGMLRKLAGAGVRLDLSYGPIGQGIAGYLFGTCFPFVPIDTNGFPLPILELPFLFQDDEDFASEYLDSIFDTTTFQSEIVNVVFHNNTMGHSPDTLLMWGWRESFQRAKDANLPIVHYTDVIEALRKQDATMPTGILNEK